MYLYIGYLIGNVESMGKSLGAECGIRRPSNSRSIGSSVQTSGSCELLRRRNQADGDGRGAGAADNGVRAVVGWAAAGDIEDGDVDAARGWSADHAGDSIDLVDECLEISDYGYIAGDWRKCTGVGIDDGNGHD